MKIRYEASFEKDLRKIRDRNVLKKIKGVIEDVRKADRLTTISHLKKIKTYDTFYRIRTGDYRIGVEATEDEVIFADYNAFRGGLKSALHRTFLTTKDTKGGTKEHKA